MKVLLEGLEGARLGIVLLSPQARVALCREYKLGPKELMYRLDKLLHSFKNT